MEELEKLLLSKILAKISSRINGREETWLFAGQFFGGVKSKFARIMEATDGDGLREPVSKKRRRGRGRWRKKESRPPEFPITLQLRNDYFAQTSRLEARIMPRVTKNLRLANILTSLVNRIPTLLPPPRRKPPVRGKTYFAYSTRAA